MWYFFENGLLSKWESAIKWTKRHISGRKGAKMDQVFIPQGVQ